MPKEMERFGTVKVISGEFKGRIGYYDDDDYIFPDGIVFDDNDKNEDIIDNAIPAAIVYFGYKPQIIQTDNGAEFTHITKTDRIHPLDVLCNKENIEHKLIKPRTPRHNGKVERSHRNDQQRFYQFLKFYSYDDLLKQMKSYLKRSNNIPMSVLNYKTPNEFRKMLEQNKKLTQLS